MENNNNIWEYKESINRLQASPQEVEKVKQQIEYSNRLVKAHNVMKVLDLADDEDNIIRKLLLKVDDTTLEELAKKSPNEIQAYIINIKNWNVKNMEAQETQKNDKKEELKNWLLDENKNQITEINKKDNENKQEESLEDIKYDEKFSNLKSFLPKSILTNHSKLSKNFESLALLDGNSITEQEKKQKKELQDDIINYLKNWDILKSITDQLWWANTSNEEYQKFKANLLAVDSGFKPLFDELEKTKSKETPNADTIAKQIEKESGGMINIDLNSKTPLSKISLIWSSYSFDELIDKKALDKITTEKEEKLDEVQSSEATLKGLAKPFENIANESKQNFWKEDFKDKVQWVINNFPKNIFSEANEMYEKMGIKSDIQIKESDITSLINASSENDLRLKITNIEEKFEKVQAHIEDIKAKIEAKHQTDVKELLSLKSKEQEKQIEVLKFMKDSGFDLIPKEISDKFIRDIQANTLQIPWLDLDTKNINLKNGNFWESVLYKDDGLNIHSKTNMLKFMNKMISWDINQPLKIESIANGTEKVNPSFLQNKFLETWIVDSLGWREGKISENLTKASVENKAK